MEESVLLASTILVILNVFYLSKIYVPEQQGNVNLTTYDYNYEKNGKGIPVLGRICSII